MIHQRHLLLPNCIPVVVLNNCEPELSHILAKLLSMCLKESCFPDCWKVWSVVSVFLRILGKGLLLKITAPLVSLWLIKSSKNLQILGLFITKRNMAFFSDLQYGLRSSWSTADFLTVVSDRIARAFNRSGATQAVSTSYIHFIYWHAGLLHKRKSYGISGQIFDLMSSFLNNRQLWVVLDRKSPQEYPVNAGVSQGSIPWFYTFPTIH